MAKKSQHPLSEATLAHAKAFIEQMGYTVWDKAQHAAWVTRLLLDRGIIAREKLGACYALGIEGGVFTNASGMAEKLGFKDKTPEETTEANVAALIGLPD